MVTQKTVFRDAYGLRETIDYTMIFPQLPAIK